MKITKKSGGELTIEYRILNARVKQFDKMITNRLVVLIKRYLKADKTAYMQTERSVWEAVDIVAKLEYIRAIEAELKDFEPKQLSLDLNQLQPLK
jgi:hypothetical protein